jgi:DNA recombination protein RmuC
MYLESIQPYFVHLAVAAFLPLPLLTGIIVYLILRGKAKSDLDQQSHEAELKSTAMVHDLAARTMEQDVLKGRMGEVEQKLLLKTEGMEKTQLAEARLQTRLAELEEQRQMLSEGHEVVQLECGQLRADNSHQREQIAHLQTTLHEQQKQNEEKLALLNDARTSLNAEFKNLAHEIFDAKQKTFNEQSKVQLDSVLKPLGEKIKDFEKRVADSYNQESKDRFSLIKEVKNLQELNSRISQDAINLTNALKGESKTQGTWGEVILERVLEKSGLVKGREYEVQISLKSEDGKRYQPDVIVHLPEGKDIIIDSKVSLTAYERYCSADGDGDGGTERADALKLHIQSLRQHIKQLSEKDYHKLDGVRTLDFVFLFVPIEAAFSLGVQQDNDLYLDAFDKNIVMVAPSTLLATLRTIQNIWRYEQQNKNAQEIANKAGDLYDKFVNFVSDLEDVGTRLGTLQKSYDKAHNKLISGRGSLVGRAEVIKGLGAKVSKSLPQGMVENALDISDS